MDSDWTTVTGTRKKVRKATAPKMSAALNATRQGNLNTARRQGVPAQPQEKFAAGTNKQRGTVKNIAKLDRETEATRHETVPLDVGKLIMQGRQAMGLSQKDLAAKICEKQQVVTDYEAGRGIPNSLILAKISKVIGIRLRGKNRGEPLNVSNKK